VDDGRDRQIRQREPMGWGQVRERAVEVVVEHPTPRRRLRLIRRHRTGLDPHREQVKVAIAVQIGQPRAGGQVLSAGFGLSGRLGELALAVAQQKQVLPGPAQPEIEVAIVVIELGQGLDRALTREGLGCRRRRGISRRRDVRRGPPASALQQHSGQEEHRQSEQQEPALVQGNHRVRAPEGRETGRGVHPGLLSYSEDKAAAELESG